MQKNAARTLLACLLVLPFLLLAQPKIQLVQYVSGFTRPVDIAHCGDNRLFIVEQAGLIWVVDSLGNRLPTPFLNIDPRVRSTGNEQGLLGLAFPPDFAQSGVFYVYYTRETDGDTRVSRFSLKPGNPNEADPDSEEILVTQDQPYSNHNGGCIKFGPDGYLYIGLGDGGNGGDPQNYGQTKNTLLGKILRIDVGGTSPGLPYAIPPDNPFVNDPAFRPEIWSWGWRNPWRFSFDRLTGDLWVADVGQGTREEVDFEPAGTGGRNYGWRCYEGTFPYNTTGCLPASNYTGPVFDFDNNSLGCSVTGGFRYRGAKYSDMYGQYLFTDYCSGRWWAINPQVDGTYPATQLANLADFQYSSLGEDRNGELYVAALSQGIIYKITELCSSFQVTGAVTDASCQGLPDGTIDLQVSGGVAPYTFSWSNNGTDSMIVDLAPGIYTVQAQDAQGCIRRDTFEVVSVLEIPAPGISVLSWSAVYPDPVVICPGDTVLLEAAQAPVGMGYQWFFNNQELSNETSRQLVARQAGQYEVVFTDGICSSPASDQFVLNQVEFADWPLTLNGPAQLCAGDTTTLVAGPAPAGFDIVWHLNGGIIPGASGLELQVGQGGSYTVTVEKPGCQYGSSFPVIVEETVIPEPQVTVVGDLNICEQDSVQLLAADAPPGSGYQWYKNDTPVNGATAQLLIVKNAGNYQVRYTHPNCPTPLSPVFTVNQSFTPLIEKQNGDILTINGQYLQVQWLYFNGDTWEPISGATDTVYQATTEGLFSVQVTDLFGCVYQAEPVGIASTALPENVREFRLAPNPTNDVVTLTFQLKQPERVQLKILDAQQRQLAVYQQQGQRIEQKIDLRDAPAGTYYLHIRLESGNFVRAIVRN